MTSFLMIITVLLILFIPISLYRMIKGPTIFDRLLAAGAIGSKTTIIIVLIGLIYNRLDMFVDIAIAYAILNFIGTIAMAKYFTTVEQDK